MDGSGTHRVEGDLGNRPDSPASVVGGQASHAPPTNEPEQVVGGTMGILQQLAQPCKEPGNQLQLLRSDQPLKEWQGTDP